MRAAGPDTVQRLHLGQPWAAASSGAVSRTLNAGRSPAKTGLDRRAARLYPIFNSVQQNLDTRRGQVRRRRAEVRVNTTPHTRFSPVQRGAPAPAQFHQWHFERVLGTALEVQLLADHTGAAEAGLNAILAEIERLEQVYSRFLPGSELNRWLATRDQAVPVSTELAGLLARSLGWQARTGSAFHPGAEALGQLWRGAADAGHTPDADALASLVGQLQAPLWSVDLAGPSARHLSPLPLNFNAIAKGRVVDAAVGAAGAVPGVRAGLVNIGGDLRHFSQAPGRPLAVAVADPRGRTDNAAPLARVRLRGQALASSGGGHRGYATPGGWHSHVLDPRTGWPAGRTAGASVIADDAETADVLATALNVLDPEQGLALVGRLPRVGCLLVRPDGTTLTNSYWRHHAVRTPFRLSGLLRRADTRGQA